MTRRLPSLTVILLTLFLLAHVAMYAFAFQMRTQETGQRAGEPPIAQPQHMRYMRALKLAAPAPQACAVLDTGVFAHAEPFLKDIRIFPAAPNSREVPYAITESQTATAEVQRARVLNLSTERASGEIVFDLAMPDRPYSTVMLQLDPAVHDFLATATVSGMDSPAEAGKARLLGVFTLFDLAGQRLSRDTTLPLAESTLRYLHVVLKIAPAAGRTGALDVRPQIVQSAEVPPSREAQTIFALVAETRSITNVGRESRASFEVPAHVPIERVSFVLDPGFTGNFSRDVRVTAKTLPPKGAEADPRVTYPEQLGGSILRVHATQSGREIRSEQLSVPAVLGANLQDPATVDVIIENGDDRPLPLAAVRLEMRQRQLCFDPTAATGALNVFYGDDRLDAPVYDFARLFTSPRDTAVADLGPEQANPNYAPPADNRTLLELHPQLLWIALIVVICILGAVAIRASKNVGR